MARPSSRTKLKRQNVNILAVCEGETEKNYFDYVVKEYMRQRDKKFIKIDAQIFKYSRAVAKYIERRPAPFDLIYYIGDLDTCDNNDAEIRRLESIERDRVGWKTIYSYPAIEFWYILHAKTFSRPFATTREVKDCLIKFHEKYEKPMPRDAFEAKWFLDRLDAALQNEKSLQVNDRLNYSNRIRPDPKRPLMNPMSEIGSVIHELLAI